MKSFDNRRIDRQFYGFTGAASTTGTVESSQLHIKHHLNSFEAGPSLSTDKSETKISEYAFAI